MPAITPSPHRRFLSVVVSAYNEEGNLPHLHAELTASLAGVADLRYELIFVNDGSTDGTLACLTDLVARDPWVRVVNLLRNHGHELAMTAGMDFARGDGVLFMDADLQHPPRIVPELVRSWQQGADIVLTNRVDNLGQSSVHKLTAKLFYRILNHFSEVAIPAGSPDFRLIDRKYVQILVQMRETNRMFRGLISWLRAPRTAVVDFVAPARFAGRTKYSLARLLMLAFDSIISFSIKPLRFATYAGVVCAVVSVLLGIKFVWDILATPNYPHLGYGTIITMVIFMGSVQLIVIGILGEYLGRIHMEVKHRPLYIAEYHVSAEQPELRTEPREGDVRPPRAEDAR